MAWFEHGTSRVYFEAQGDGTPVLVLPGLFTGIEEFSRLRDALVASGYHVIAADLPGSGRSEPQPRVYTASSYEEDAHALAALLRHLASAPAHVVGFSDGGEVALLMAALIPDATRLVVTWGAAGVLSDPGGQVREAIANVVDHPTPPLQGWRDYLVSTYGEVNARAMTQSRTAAVSSIIEAGGELGLSKAGTIACPVLLVTCEQDIFAALGRVFRLAARLCTAEVLVAEGVEDVVSIGCPEWLTHAILDWLGKHGG